MKNAVEIDSPTKMLFTTSIVCHEQPIQISRYISKNLKGLEISSAEINKLHFHLTHYNKCVRSESKEFE